MVRFTKNKTDQSFSNIMMQVLKVAARFDMKAFAVELQMSYHRLRSFSGILRRFLKHIWLILNTFEYIDDVIGVEKTKMFPT